MWKYLFKLIIVFSLLPIGAFGAEDLSHITGAGGTVYFAWDGEAQSYSADAGTASFTALGGDPSNIEGDASADCPSSIDTDTYHYTILSNETAAQGAVPGSSYSLKTPYDGGCNGESTSRDRTSISLASDVTELYIRWYQKFSGNWMNGSIQHKLTKFTPLAHAEADAYSTGYFTFRSNTTHFSLQSVNNADGQFNGDGVTTRAASCVITSTEASSGSQGEGTYWYWDNYNNGLDGGSDGEFDFSTDTWYCIEIHIKVNTDVNTSDAEAELWVDGTKVFGLSNFKWYDSGDSAITGLGFLEMQHIYYTRATNDDQPTYMDNIVIADRYIGPIQTQSQSQKALSEGSYLGSGASIQ